MSISEIYGRERRPSPPNRHPRPRECGRYADHIVWYYERETHHAEFQKNLRTGSMSSNPTVIQSVRMNTPRIGLPPPKSQRWS